MPRGTDNPIDYMAEEGVTVPKLAFEWGIKPDAVYRLRRYEYVPSYPTAKKMALTFGWASAGEVMDYWAARVES